MPDAPLIDRDLLFGNPDKAMPQLSPDGARVSFLAPVDGVLNVWVGPRSDPDAARPVTRDTLRGIRIYFWAYTSRHILYLQDQGGDENWRVYCVDLDSGETRDLTPFEGVAAQIQEVSPKFPEKILVALNQRNPMLHDVYRIDIRTGERELVMENPGVAGFYTDRDLNIRLAVQITPDGGMGILRVTPEKNFEPFFSIPAEDAMTTHPLGFDKSGEVLYLFDSRGRDTSALTTLSLKTGEEILLKADPRADGSGVLIHPTERHVQAVSFTYDRTRWEILDPAIAPDFEALAAVSGGELNVISRTLDDQLWLVAYLEDAGPVRYYAWDRQKKEARFLFTNRKELEGQPLRPMHPVIIPARDGLSLVSYLTLPPGASHGTRPESPLPMVLLVHGGPWARDTWGYNPFHQLFANRGYAVLSVNFRGSTGFGKAFINAANGEWGGKMHDDLLDAVDWAVKEGIADPARVAIIGGSYGGYATLWGLTRTPDVFACGVDIVGPSNLITLFQNTPPYWAPILSLIKTRVGDWTTPEGQAFLTERSPLTYVENIKKPLLIGQGANDPRVKQVESDQIVKAMQEKNIPVTYVLYPDEGHGFARPENNLSFLGIAEVFLSKYLGGRHQPLREKDFQNSSITIPEGADLLPGVGEFLGKRA